MTRILVLLVALAAAAGATFLASGWIEGRRTRLAAEPSLPAAAQTKGVLVAARSLAVGQFLQPDDVRWQPWPDVDLPPGYLVEGQQSVDDVAGAVLRRPAAEGEPINRENVVKPGERGFLAAVLDPDMRAISVPVDEASSNAGLIFPGDRVDLVLTQVLAQAEGASEQRRVSETVLEDVRVLAMGRRLTSEDEVPGGSQARTTTLEVTPAGAEKVALVTELGKLSLSLRSLARRDPAAPTPPAPAVRVTWDDDVSPVLRPENQPRTTMAVVRGPESKTVSIPRGAQP